MTFCLYISRSHPATPGQQTPTFPNCRTARTHIRTTSGRLRDIRELGFLDLPEPSKILNFILRSIHESIRTFYLAHSSRIHIDLNSTQSTYSHEHTSIRRKSKCRHQAHQSTPAQRQSLLLLPMWENGVIRSTSSSEDLKTGVHHASRSHDQSSCLQLQPCSDISRDINQATHTSDHFDITNYSLISAFQRMNVR